MTRKILIVTVLAGLSFNAMAQEQGDWLVRLGLGHVSPDVDSRNLVFEGIELDGYRVDVDDSTRPVFNLTWMASEHIGLELLAAWPFNHRIEGDGALSGLGKLGSTKHLPPTFSLQYHFMPGRNFRPYAGIGFNYTYFFDEKTAGTLHQGIIGTSNAALGTDYNGGTTDIEIDDSFGIALQLGTDVALNDYWFLNFDLRWIDIEADAKLHTTTFDGDGFQVDLDSRVRADIDPWVFTTAIGLRF